MFLSLCVYVLSVSVILYLCLNRSVIISNCLHLYVCWDCVSMRVYVRTCIHSQTLFFSSSFVFPIVLLWKSRKPRISLLHTSIEDNNNHNNRQRFSPRLGLRWRDQRDKGGKKAKRFSMNSSQRFFNEKQSTALGFSASARDEVYGTKLPRFTYVRFVGR